MVITIRQSKAIKKNEWSEEAAHPKTQETPDDKLS